MSRMRAISPGTAVRVGFVALAFVAVFALPLFVTGTDARYVLRVFTFVGVNAIIVTGLALLFGYAGQVSLGHAAFFGLGAYASAYATVRLDLPWIVGLLAAVMLTALGGMLLALPSLRLKGHYLAMATLAFGEIMHVAFVEASEITGGPDGFSGIPFASLGSLNFDTPQSAYWLVWGFAGLGLLLAHNIVRGRPGRAMLALHGSEAGALASGVRTVGLKVRVFTLSAAYAGVAGSLYAHSIGFISPSSFGLHLSVILVAMAVLGGSRSLAGPVFAAVLLTLVGYADAVIPNLSRDALALIQDWQADLYGTVIIVIMLVAPGGLAAIARRVFRRAGEVR
ncbi:MAG: branched-chain amino acid ABC transporter permease [Coriobacteriia bacterium]|nr:branched-chain amino acid ABC transporter permease [Coriobacteriia bacterium]